MFKEYLISLKSPKISKHRDQRKLTSIINKKTIRYHLNNSIREYNILPEERTPLTVVKHVLKTLFWTTVYLAFSYLTISSSFRVIHQYHDNPLATNMKAVINNNVTYLPNMTICFKINAKQLFGIYSTWTFNYLSAWTRFFEETTLEGIFKVNESQIYNDEIYLSLFKYLAMIYEAERAWEPGLTQISTFHSKENDDWIALKKILVPNIELYNITLEQLKSVFNGKFCSLPVVSDFTIPLLYRYYELDRKTECVAASNISFIGWDTICFRLIGYQNYLRQLGTTEIIALEIYFGNDNQQWCQEYTIDLGTESRSIPRRPTTQNETHAYYYNCFPCESGTVRIMMDISVKALYRKLPYVNGNIQCSSDTSREGCENKCLRGWITANCHCSPITFNLTTDISGYRNCTVDDYSICLKEYDQNVTYLCTSKCVPLCEQWHYEYSTAHTESETYGIKLRTFDYVIIEQVFKWPSFEEFIGALGGALGIWLGLDFVIIIEFIVKLVTMLIKKILLRKAPNSEEDEHRKSPNIKNREENVENGISSSNEIGSRAVGHQKKYKENGNKIGGTSIHQINESEKQRASRKKGESNAVKEKHGQQRRKRSNKNRVDSIILENEMKNTDAHGGYLGSHSVNITDNVDAVQDESTAHAKSCSVRSWFLRKMLLLLLNGDASTKKSVLFLRFVEKLFWTAIYLIGSIFTTLWCVQLINLYLADEAVYFPSLITNRTVSLPPPSLCIAYQNWLFLVGYDNCSDVLMDYFRQSNIDKASFIQVSDEKPWPELLVAMGLLYIGTLAASETNYMDISFVAEYESQLWRTPDDGNMLSRNDIDKLFNDIFLPKVLEWNVTANELRQKLGAELARRAELKISFTNSSGTTDIVNETFLYTTAITDDKFCYSLAYAVNFTDPDDSLEFSINAVPYKSLINTRKGNFLIFSDYLQEPKSAQFDIDDPNNVPVFDSTYLKFDYGKKARILISVDSLYTSRPAEKGVEYCSPNTTKLYCRAQCRIKLIEKLCNCSPTYWTTMMQPTSGLDECTFDRYKKCLNFNASDDLDCKDSCLPFCTARYFRSDRLNDLNFELYTELYIAVARFSLKDNIYVSIEEKLIFTFSDMLIKV